MINLRVIYYSHVLTDPINSPNLTIYSIKFINLRTHTILNPIQKCYICYILYL